MDLLLTLFSLLLPSALASGGHSCVLKTKTVAVVDTGFGYHDLGHDIPLCKFGHKDFSSERKFSGTYDTIDKVPVDNHGHGTNIAGLISKFAGKGNYCIVVIKYYSEYQTGSQNLASSIAALNYAKNLHVDYLNYSGGGPALDFQEMIAVKGILYNNTVFVAAALNENKNIDLYENSVYPAMYDKRIIVVGNLGANGQKSPSSNFGSRVTRWEIGENQEALGITMTGTSQATAVATGKIIADSLKRCDR